LSLAACYSEPAIFDIFVNFWAGSYEVEPFSLAEQQYCCLPHDVPDVLKGIWNRPIKSVLRTPFNVMQLN